MSTIRMSIEEWIKMAANPRQRDTERHAQRAKHLLTPSPDHAHVSAAKLPDGKLIKLDGHTRALLWKRKKVEPPKAVEVSIIPVHSMEQAMEIYTHFDSKDALETTQDKVSGGYNEIGFKPESAFLQGGRIGNALRIAWRVLQGVHRAANKDSVYTIINEFAEEILALDDLDLPKNAAKSGIVAAFILSYRKHGSKVIPFWKAFFANSGKKINGHMDAVQALTELILRRRNNHGGSANDELCSRALTACEKWLRDENMTSIPRPLDLPAYLTKTAIRQDA